jgi:hypothetical protein
MARKMELFSRAFFPAVVAALDCPSALLFGTIPSPRYGRTIAEVEQLSARPDVEVKRQPGAPSGKLCMFVLVVLGRCRCAFAAALHPALLA